MNDKQFDICLAFHLGLIRSRPHKQTIDDARDGISNSAANNLRDALKDRFDSLIQWGGLVSDITTDFASDFVMRNIYNKQNTRNPSLGAFTAAFSVISNSAEISKAAKAAGVNYQSVKVLIPRLNRWEEFAQKLAKTL